LQSIRPLIIIRWCDRVATLKAPYVHARLQAVTLGGDPDKPIKVDSGSSDLEDARHLAFILAKATKKNAA
jgi:hypothetical protein